MGISSLSQQPKLNLRFHYKNTILTQAVIKIVNAVIWCQTAILMMGIASDATKIVTASIP